MSDRELLEAILGKIANMEATMATKDELAEIRSTMATKDELYEVKNDLRFVKETVIRIENDHGQKLGALFDGYKLVSEKLDRIEEEVAKHEEIILRKIR